MGCAAHAEIRRRARVASATCLALARLRPRAKKQAKREEVVAAHGVVRIGDMFVVSLHKVGKASTDAGAKDLKIRGERGKNGMAPETMEDERLAEERRQTPLIAAWASACARADLRSA